MYDDLVFLPPLCCRTIFPIRIQGAEFQVGQVGVSSFMCLLDLALVKERSYAQAEGLALRPAAVGKGRIVGSGGGEVPLLVRGIETRAVPDDMLVSSDQDTRRE